MKMQCRILMLLAWVVFIEGRSRWATDFQLVEEPYSIGLSFVSFEIGFFFQPIDDSNDTDPGEDISKEAEEVDCIYYNDFEVCGSEKTEAMRGLSYLKNPMSSLRGGNTICIYAWFQKICFENDNNYYDLSCVKLPYGKGFVCFRGEENANKNGVARFKRGRSSGESCLRHHRLRLCVSTASYELPDIKSSEQFCHHIGSVTICLKCLKRNEQCSSKGLLTICVKCGFYKGKKENIDNAIARIKQNRSRSLNIITCIRMGIFEICRT